MPSRNLKQAPIPEAEPKSPEFARFTLKQIDALRESLRFLVGYLDKLDEFIEPASVAKHADAKAQTKVALELLNDETLSADWLKRYTDMLEKRYGVNRKKHLNFAKNLDALTEIVKAVRAGE